MTRPPRIADPRAFPVVCTDAHLPAVDADRLEAEPLRRRFAAPPAFAPEFAGDTTPFGRKLAPASVLVPLVQRPQGLQVLLTRRTEHLRDHAGQISFPGGRAEPDDADAVAAALRETEEEIGLARTAVDVIGALPTYTTITDYVVTPVVALVQPPFQLRLDAHEVAEAFEVPLHFLMTPANHCHHRFEWQGRQREFLSMPWDAVGGDGRLHHYFIWGATAAMLRNLYAFLAR